MLWLRRISLACLASASLVTAAPHVDFDPAVDFQAWQSFSYSMPAPDAKPTDPMDNELLHKRLRAAIIDELAERKKTVDDAAPQFRVRASLWRALR